MSAPFSHLATSTPLPTYTVERGGFQIITEAKLRQLLVDGYYDSGMIDECVTPHVARVKRNGSQLEIALNVPLCACEAPLDHGVCNACMTVYVDAPETGFATFPVIPLGAGYNRVVAA